MKTLSEAIAVHTKGEMPEPAQTVRADIPPIIDTILNQALAKDRAIGTLTPPLWFQRCRARSFPWKARQQR